MTNLLPDQYAVIGDPIQHSLSPLIHRLFATQTGQFLTYHALLVSPENLAQALHRFRHAGGLGVNVTLPLKEHAFEWVSHKTERAEAAGSVNTITFQHEQALGDNTDGVGFLRDLVDRQGHSIKDKHVLILGAGGATRGLIQPILSQLPARLHIANRTIEKAQKVIEDFCSHGTITAGSLTDLTADFDFIINATPTGLFETELCLPENLFACATVCYDLAYGRTTTPFLQRAKDLGVPHISDGLGMLVEQAAEAFYLWRGVKPQTEPVLQRLFEHLTERKTMMTIPADFVYFQEIQPTVKQEIRYATPNNFVGRPIAGYEKGVCILTQKAAHALSAVQKMVHEKYDYSILLFDCYRPSRASEDFKQWASDPNDQTQKAVYYPNINKKDFFKLNYVAEKSSHSRGSTVDLTLIDNKTGKSLDMGTPFDFMDPLSSPDNRDITEQQFQNRQLLKSVMQQQGFVGIESEWWHFTLKDEPYVDQYFDFAID